MDRLASAASVPASSVPPHATAPPVQYGGLAPLQRRPAMSAKSRELFLKSVIVLAVMVFSLLPEPLKAQFATTGFMHRFSHFAAFFITYVVIAARVRRFSVSAALAILLV